MKESTTAISARGLRKSYGDIDALCGVDLDLPRGTVLGVLGPNGAGKTTMVRMLATLLPVDEGTATVAGFDVATAPRRVRERIGYTGQGQAVDEYLTGRENLVLFGRLHGLRAVAAADRAQELLGEFDLLDAADRIAKTYSGGMRRRLDLAASIMVEPDVLFLDEPTTGLDPRSRRDVWSAIERLRAAGTSVLLTTQYLDEADRLSDDIIVIDRGQIIARGTSSELKEQIGGERIEVRAGQGSTAGDVHRVLEHVTGAAALIDSDDDELVTAPLAQGAERLADVVRAFDAAGVRIGAIGIRQPTLDDVFLHLTGHATDHVINAQTEGEH